MIEMISLLVTIISLLLLIGAAIYETRLAKNYKIVKKEDFVGNGPEGRSEYKRIGRAWRDG